MMEGVRGEEWMEKDLEMGSSCKELLSPVSGR
jgi:hypothetical protein